MKKITLASVLAVLCLYVVAQENAVIKPLMIGDRVPDVKINIFVNYSTRTAKLSDFKGKLVILDFWATWCGSCIHKFSLLDSLQNRYPDEIQIISINNTRRTKDTPEKIAALIQRWQRVNAKTFAPIIVTDSTDLYKKLFPHKSIPHYVWISSDRTVVAITGSEEVKEQNLNAFLKGQKLSVPVKDDFPAQLITNRP